MTQIKEAIEEIEQYIVYPIPYPDREFEKALYTVLKVLKMVEEAEIPKKRDKNIGVSIARTESYNQALEDCQPIIAKLQLELDFAQGKKGSIIAFQEGVIEGKQLRINQLYSELNDIKEAHVIIMDEKFHGDEKHCTCVPALRSEIKRLKLENEELKAKLK